MDDFDNNFRNPLLGKQREPLDPLNLPAGIQGRLMQMLPNFRYILPPGTTTSFPILQQAWEDMQTGAIEWRRVPLVIVPEDEFRSGYSPPPERTSE
jgi:hypothetical protein